MQIKLYFFMDKCDLGWYTHSVFILLAYSLIFHRRPKRSNQKPISFSLFWSFSIWPTGTSSCIVCSFPSPECCLISNFNRLYSTLYTVIMNTQMTIANKNVQLIHALVPFKFVGIASIIICKIVFVMVQMANARDSDIKP